MALLPSFFVLASSGKYLSVTANNSKSSLPSGFLKFEDIEIWSPRVKFAVEPAETGDGALVHIRSCYNNKYLVTEEIANNFWIVASAKKPEEDRTNASCTLFELSSSSEPTTVRLRHVQTQIMATHSLSPDDGDTQHGMLVVSSSSDGSAFRAIDSKSLIVLPSRVAFKTDETATAKYLCSRSLDSSRPYQQFMDGYDIGDELVAKELFPTASGYYRVRDLYFEKFWRRSPNWIWADAWPDNYSSDTLFSVVQVGDNVIALNNLGNNYFCGPLTTDGKTNCLNAHYPTLTNQARLVIEETVIERKISDIIYRTTDSRIYGEKIIECDHYFATNETDQTDNMTVKFSITDSKTTSWSNSLSIKFGGKIDFKTDFVPLIVSGRVEVSTEVGYTHVWGGSTVDTFTRELSYSVPVPKYTTVKVTLMCSRASCDVPFFYTQSDLFPNRVDWVTTFKEDGMFTGINSYNFHVQSEVVP